MEQTVLQSIARFAMETPEKLAVVDTTTQLTYQAYWAQICRCATYLRQHQIGKNQYVMVKNTQDTNILTLVHGVQLAGAICIPLEKSVNQGRVLEILEETNAVCLITNEPMDGVASMAPGALLQWDNMETDWTMPSLKDVAMILFTTGTTGKSKGIVISYGAEFAAEENVRYGVEMKPDNVEIIPMPMNHSYSLRRYYGNLINGSTTIVLDGVFFVKIFFQMMEQYAVTAVAMAPAAIGIIFKLTRDKLADYVDQLDYLQFGTAPLPEGDKERLLKLFPNVRLYNIYGSTEMSSSCILNFNSPDNRPNCIGYPAVNAHYKVVDGDGDPMEQATREHPGFLAGHERILSSPRIDEGNGYRRLLAYQ